MVWRCLQSRAERRAVLIPASSVVIRLRARPSDGLAQSNKFRSDSGPSAWETGPGSERSTYPRIRDTYQGLSKNWHLISRIDTTQMMVVRSLGLAWRWSSCVQGFPQFTLTMATVTGCNPQKFSDSELVGWTGAAVQAAHPSKLREGTW